MLGKGWREWQGALLGERKRRLGVLQDSFEPHPPSLLGRLQSLPEASAMQLPHFLVGT